ncbi:MAG: hypothetical protein J1E85_10675 [Ruminococcus sp.]|nr:hypothetical protein [Ruminococcus sp.]
MPITAEELYNKLLDIKNNQPNHQFDEMDLLPFGNVDAQLKQLINEGKIIKNNDVIESFKVVS